MTRSSRRLLAAVVTLLAIVPLCANPAGLLEPDFTGWKRVETAHFVFVFEPRDQAAVNELTSFAEDVYQDVTGFIGSSPARIWVVVAGRIDLANAYTDPVPPHITLYLAPPSEPLMGLEASQYLRLLLVHELTHFVNFEYDKGLFASLSAVFGPAVKDANAAFLPTWFLEGIATHTETLFTDGGRGRNPFFELEYRAFVLSHRFFPLSQAAYSSYFPPADRDWIGGYLFFRYLIDHFGKDIYIRIHDEYVKFPLLGPWKAIERATGRPAEAMYRDMVSELEARYGSQPPVEEGNHVMPDLIGDYFLPVTTSRGWYLYRSTLDEAPAIVRYDPLTKRERRLLAAQLTDSVSLTASADGERIVFSTFDATLGRSGEVVVSDLFGLTVSTGEVRRVTTGGHAWQPRLSPDGSRLLAVSAAGPCSRLVEVDQQDGSLHLLFSARDAIVSTPSFSPDGSRVAFEVAVHGTASIRVLPLPSPERPVSAYDPLTDFNVDAARVVIGPAEAGAWYPRFEDNENLLFSSEASGTLALYSTDIDTGQSTLVCEDPVGAWAGELAGDKVLYATYRAGGYTLMMKPLQQLQSSLPAAARTPQEDEAGAVTGKTAPYVDFPRFLAWTPLPFYYSTIASAEIVAAPGAALWGVSNLGTSSYFASTSFRTDALQPAVELSLHTMLGTVGLGYSLSEGYTNLSPTDHREELRQQIGLSFPLISSTELSTTTALIVTAAVNDTLSAAGPQAFSFRDGLGNGAGSSSLSYSHDIDAAAGVGYLRSVIGSAMDLFPTLQVEASASISAYPPGISASGPGVVASGLVSVSLPSPVPHQVIKLGIKASYVGLNESFYQVTNPRGAFDLVTQSLPGRTLLSLDYQVPIALLDAPLVYSFGLVGIGCGFHLEMAADWAAAPAVLLPDQYLYTGAEIVLMVAAGEQAFPVGLGVSFRFDPRFALPPNWAEDLRPYIFISTDSFAGTILGAVAVREPLH
jgi:Tol biopolymer transport system component